MSVQISQLPNITSTQLTSGTTTSLSMPLIASVSSGNVTTYQTSFANVKTYIETGNLNVTGNLDATFVRVLTGIVPSTSASPAPSISGFGAISTTGNASGNISASGNLIASRDAFITGNITANGNTTVNGLTVNTSGVFTTTVQAKGGLQNTPIGNVAGQASSGSFTTVTANGNVTASALTVNASTTIGTTLGVTGNVIFTGNFGVDGGTVTMLDSILDLHTYANLAAWTVDDGKDVGIRMHYYKGADTLAFFGIENSSNTLQYLQNATETSSNVTGTFGNVQFGSLLLSNSTVSANTTTGALRVVGGIGVGGDINVSGNVLVTGTGNMGYGTGAGGTVTQGTGRATGVTINKATGNIILFSAAGNTTPTTFTVTNSFVANSDVIILNQRTGTNIYLLLVSNVANGSFNITAYTTGGTTTEAPVINFAVINGVTA